MAGNVHEPLAIGRVELCVRFTVITLYCKTLIYFIVTVD